MNTLSPDLEALRQALVSERDDLLGSSLSTAASRDPVKLDQQSVGRLSRMDALQVQAMAQAEEARRQQRLRLIEAALRRIDEGEYGYCVTCGDDIPGKRLAFDPAAARCVDCAQ
jgi:DnaK suppressor protein